MANNQNFIVKHGLTVGGNQFVVDQYGNWVGPETAYANASFSVANVKSHVWTQDTKPLTANVNDVWIDSSNGIQYTYIQDTDTTQWVEFGPIGTPTGNIIFSDQSIIGSVADRDMFIIQQGSGNLILQSANTFVRGPVHITSNTVPATEAWLQIVGSDGDTYQLPANPGTMIHVTGKANTSSRIINDSHGTGAYSLFAGRTSRGTALNPTAIQAGDVIARYSGSAHDGTSFPALGVGRIDIVATENHTPSNKGSEIQIWSTVKNSNTLTEIATFDGNTATFIGFVKPSKGFIFTPRTITGNTTNIVIDFSSDSAIRASVNNACSITFTNYIAGKVVDVWITNVSGSAKTITHGVSELNSTTNSTTESIPGTASCYFKYCSWDGDSANTFVAIVRN